MNIKNIALYAFFKPAFELEATREALLSRMQALCIKGTILLSYEGINGSFCGIESDIDTFLNFLFETIGIERPPIKISYSKEMVFKHSKVKIKKFIVPQPGSTPIDPVDESAPYVSPEELHAWLGANKDMVLLDTRNDYEYTQGRFKSALHLGTKHFKDFEGNLSQAPSEWQNRPVVTFCTGGIRCEKAAPLMIKKGFKQVYQLEGGILNYFTKMGRGFFEGECFVFDERRAVDEALKEANG